MENQVVKKPGFLRWFLLFVGASSVAIVIILCFVDDGYGVIRRAALDCFDTALGSPMVTVCFCVGSAILAAWIDARWFGGVPLKDVLHEWARGLLKPAVLGPTTLGIVVFMANALIFSPAKLRKDVMAASQSNQENSLRSSERTKLKSDIQHQRELFQARDTIRNEYLAAGWKPPEHKNGADSKEFQKMLNSVVASSATNGDPVRAILSAKLPEPIQIPAMDDKFDLGAVRKAKADEAKRLMVAEAIAAHDRAASENASAQQAKIDAENAKAKSAARLKICNFITDRLLRNISEIASAHGDSLSSDFNGSLKRNGFPSSMIRLEKFVSAQMAVNTNWNFKIMLLTDNNLEKLMIVCPQNAAMRLRGKYNKSIMGYFSGSDSDVVGLEFSFENDQVSCQLLGARNPLPARPTFQIAEWQAYSDHLTAFIAEVDERYPPTNKAP